MKTTIDLNTGLIYLGEIKFRVSCNVRSLRNRTRNKDEVVRTIPGGRPYDPLPFPKGHWKITAVEWWKTENGRENFDRNVYGPCKIRTDAWQPVKVWALDYDGDYAYETDQFDNDAGYLFHYSKSKTTLGCIRSESEDDISIIGRMIEPILALEDFIDLEVI